MAKMEKWEKYWLLAFTITLIVVFLVIFLFVPGFFETLMYMFWHDRYMVIFFISILVAGPYMLAFIIILLIKRRK